MKAGAAAEEGSVDEADAGLAAEALNEKAETFGPVFGSKPLAGMEAAVDNPKVKPVPKFDVEVSISFDFAAADPPNMNESSDEYSLSSVITVDEVAAAPDENAGFLDIGSVAPNDTADRFFGRSDSFELVSIDFKTAAEL